MSSRQGHHPRFDADPFEHHTVEHRQWRAHEGRVDGRARHRGNLLGPVQLDQLHLRMQRIDHRTSQTSGRPVDESDPQPPGPPTLECVEPVHRANGELESGPRIRDEHLTRGGEHHRMRTAIDQLDSHLLLESSNLLTEGGRGDEQPVCRSPEVPFRHDDEQRGHQTQIQIFASSRLLHYRPFGCFRPAARLKVTTITVSEQRS